MEVTLQLPDKLYERAKQWAMVTHQELDEATNTLTGRGRQSMWLLP